LGGDAGKIAASAVKRSGEIAPSSTAVLEQEDKTPWDKTDDDNIWVSELQMDEKHYNETLSNGSTLHTTRKQQRGRLGVSGQTGETTCPRAMEEVMEDNEGLGDSKKNAEATLGAYWADSFPELKPMEMVRAAVKEEG
jgi:hypothetical protein